MKIVQHPFATDIVDVARDKGPPQAKILTSSSTIKSGAERSSAPQRCVTSQMLLTKFQHDRERQQRREEEALHEKEHWRCPFFVYY